MNQHSVTLNLKQVSATILVLINLIVIAPGGWLLKTLYENVKTVRAETKLQIDTLETEISQLKVDLSSDYVTRKSFSDYREQMRENLLYLDNKLLKEFHESQNH